MLQPLHCCQQTTCRCTWPPLIFFSWRIPPSLVLPAPLVQHTVTSFGLPYPLSKKNTHTCAISLAYMCKPAKEQRVQTLAPMPCQCTYICMHIVQNTYVDIQRLNGTLCGPMGVVLPRVCPGCPYPTPSRPAATLRLPMAWSEIAAECCRHRRTGVEKHTMNAMYFVVVSGRVLSRSKMRACRPASLDVIGRAIPRLIGPRMNTSR